MTTENTTFKPFPIPVVSALTGAGSQGDDGLDYMAMPRAMDVFRAPILPEVEEMTSHPDALQTLTALIDMTRRVIAGEVVPPMTLLHLSEDDLKMVNQVLGEGDVAMTIASSVDQATQIEIQETVFVGVWRVLAVAHGAKIYDALEVNYVPSVLLHTAKQDSEREYTPSPMPPELVNVPFIVEEIRSHAQAWTPEAEVHNVNLTLLPLTEVDISFIDDQLGTGRITILSRGYGNCRIVNTCTPFTWRLVYYNSQDKVILNCVEVCDVPEVACAAMEDFEDTLDRLTEVLVWFEGGNAS